MSGSQGHGRPMQLLVCDWPDVQYVANNASRFTPKSCWADQENMVRIGNRLNVGLSCLEQLPVRKGRRCDPRLLGRAASGPQVDQRRSARRRAVV